MKCGCKRNLLGVCSCKRVSRGRGRKTRRAITDEPYERAIKPRYAVPRTRRPEYNFPAIDPKRPGQVLKPGVPSVSTGFTAPSPFSRGAVSAFEPVLRAASNYLNEVTRSARLQNQMTMSNMGGGGSAGSRSNFAMNGSVDTRNTQSILSRNPSSAPINENVNVINSDGTYASFQMNGVGNFDINADIARRNLERTAAIPVDSDGSVNLIDGPQNDINYQDEIDQTIAENNLANESMNDALSQFEELNNIDRSMTEEELSQQKDQIFRLYGEADINEKKRIIDSIEGDNREKSRFLKEYFQWRKNQLVPQTPLPKNQSSSSSPSSIQTTPESNFGPIDKVTFSSDGSPMYPSGVVEINSNYKLQNPDPNAINNLMNTGFSSPVFAKANSSSSSSSSSNIGGNSRSSNLRKFQSPLGDQDKKNPPKDEKKEKDNYLNVGYKGMENIIPDSATESGSDISTEDQMEPSVYTEGSIPISSVSSKTRQSADDKVIAEQRAREEKGPDLTVRGKGNKVIEPIQTNVYKDQKDMQALANAGLNAQLDYIRQIVAYGHLKEDEQRRLLEESEKLKQAGKQAANAPVNVLVARSKKKGGGLGFSG